MKNAEFVSAEYAKALDQINYLAQENKTLRNQLEAAQAEVGEQVRVIGLMREKYEAVTQQEQNARRENERLNACCAEMRRALERVRFVSPMAEKSIAEQIEENSAIWFHALSADCGRGYVSIRELEPTLELLTDIILSGSEHSNPCRIESQRLQTLLNQHA